MSGGAVVADPVITRTTTKRLRTGKSPFDAYAGLVEVFGRGSVFLLESPGGPVDHRRHAFIGVNPMVGVRVTQDRVEWTGNPSLAAKFAEHSTARGVVRTAERRTRLVATAQVWALLRSIRDRVNHGSGDSGGLRLGLFGYLGYDIGGAVERLSRTIPSHDDTPDLDLSIYEVVIQYDLLVGEATISRHETGSAPGVDWDQVENALVGPVRATAGEPLSPVVGVTGSTGRRDYLLAAERALEYIRAGEVYQLQLGQELRAETRTPPWVVYQRLRERNPSPYAYIAPFGSRTAIGASPELMMSIEDRRVTMKPIAGTSARSADPELNRLRIDGMRSSAKEVAEHLMLVDLCRNDIGRIAEERSLRTVDLMSVEEYSHVNHLVSTVEGVLRPGEDEFDALGAAFPAGTMTGAPKIRAMQIIEELETRRRGIYAGAIGLIGFSGDVKLALCIRGAMHHDRTYTYRASAGVVADSDPQREWEETFHKLAAVNWAISGEEFDNARIAR
ncbi:anthranilate synthase component I family protein [Actinokineospora spheciospongiae]|uniref:anthranilate synthase component I family protein n=1 Tax=Actinokineospora spheciospongiae TaxID=909613 RepID=UPI000D716265|nr:anthranilate synthase component I family protein [Actinokineospora spheciospongiae]PWW58257.1 anthranilate synthase component 1 [Actinokineospora spheciospongiae]